MKCKSQTRRTSNPKNVFIGLMDCFSILLPTSDDAVLSEVARQDNDKEWMQSERPFPQPMMCGRTPWARGSMP